MIFFQMKARLPSPLTVPLSTPADTPSLPSLAIPPSTPADTPSLHSPMAVPPSTPADTPSLPSLTVHPSTTVATPDVVPVSAQLPTFFLQHLQETLKLPNSFWCDQSPNPLTSIKLCKISSHPSSSKQPLVITHCLTVDSALWCTFVHNHEVKQDSYAGLASVPLQLTPNSFSALLNQVDSLCWPGG